MGRGGGQHLFWAPSWSWGVAALLLQVFMAPWRGVDFAPQGSRYRNNVAFLLIANLSRLQKAPTKGTKYRNVAL